MQMLYVCDCTSGEYVSDKRWLQASPPDCPWCKPKGRCSLVRHGFYARLQPQGTLVRRFRCKASGRTVSMLPDCLASHWPGDLDTMEEAARQAEGKSKYKAAQERACWVPLYASEPERFLIAVGPLVAQRPPHRSGRAR